MRSKIDQIDQDTGWYVYPLSFARGKPCILQSYILLEDRDQKTKFGLKKSHIYLISSDMLNIRQLLISSEKS